MRDYGTVSPQFWIGKTGKALRGHLEAQVLALYLMTSPHANAIGVFHCPVMYMGHETGLGLEGASKGLARLIEEGFCSYEEASETVFVKRMAAFQIAETMKPKDKRAGWVQKEYEKLAEGQLKTEFFAIYSVAYGLQNQAVSASPSNGASKPLPSQEQEQEQEQDSRRGAAAPDDPDPIFGTGLAYLVRTGVPERGARSFLGKMRKALNDDLVAVELLVKAQQLEVSEPVAWLRAAAQKRLTTGRESTGVAL